MSEYEARAQIMELVKVLDQKRAEVQDVVNQLKHEIARLIGHADRMMPAAADSHPEAQGVTTRKLKYSAVPGPREMEKILSHIEKQAASAPPPLPPGKRACSNCRRPGHRAKNCPNPAVR